jgi:hypothetical protein
MGKAFKGHCVLTLGQLFKVFAEWNGTVFSKELNQFRPPIVHNWRVSALLWSVKETCSLLIE